MYVVVLSLLAIFGVAVFALLACTLEDWSRDLTTNFAELSPQAKDFRLRPIQLTDAPQAAADRVRKAVERLPLWKSQESVVELDGNGVVTLRFVRTTALLKFQDDVVVKLSPHPQGSMLTATSQSRIGKADFGQNTKNLRELTSTVLTAYGITQLLEVNGTER